MAEEPKLLSEQINSDLSATFDEMMTEMADVNKKEEEDGVREKEGKEEEGEGKEIESKPEESSSEKEELEPKEGEEESGKEEEKEPESTSFEPGELKPNSGWNKEAQEGFKQLPKDMQEFMLKRDNEMHSDYTKKTQDVADIKRALEPIREQIASMEISDGDAVRNLIAAHMLLKDNPQVGIQYLATAYEISLEDIQENWQDSETFVQNMKETGRTNKAESRVSELEMEQARKQYEEQEVEIDEFKVDHPHYDEVLPQMKELARAALVAREPKPSLQSLYDRALWLNPKTREVLMGEKKPKTGKGVKEAKKASTRGKSTSKKPEKKAQKDVSLHDELSQGWDGQVADA